MASSSSDESSKAPENFQISSTSNDEDEDDVLELNANKSSKKPKKQLDPVGSITAPSLKCLLCKQQRYRFHCRDCVRSGYITIKTQPHGEW